MDVLRPVATLLYRFGCHMRQSRMSIAWAGRWDCHHDRMQSATLLCVRLRPIESGGIENGLRFGLRTEMLSKERVCVSR